METLLEVIVSNIQMILLMILLSLLIRIYYFIESNDKSVLKFLRMIFRYLMADVIIILSILFVDVYIVEVPKVLATILLGLSENVLNWIGKNKEDITNRIMDKLISIILEWLNGLNKNKDE